MVKYKDLNVITKVGMQKRVGWGMETVGLKVGGLALYDGLFTLFRRSQRAAPSLAGRATRLPSAPRCQQDRIATHGRQRPTALRTAKGR